MGIMEMPENSSGHNFRDRPMNSFPEAGPVFSTGCGQRRPPLPALAVMVIISAMAAVAGIGLTACGRTPTPEFYLLAPLEKSPDSPAPKGRALSGAPGTKKTASAGIGPVSLPAYLERPQIVSRQADGRLRISEHHKWAGSLKQDMTRTLARNLRILLQNENLHAFPWDRAIPVKYRITVSVDRFDAVPGRTAVLDVRWNLFRRKKLLTSRRAEIRTPVNGHAYPDLIAAHSRAFSALSGEIAEAVSAYARDLRPAGKK